MPSPSARNLYRSGFALIIAISFVTVWTMIVRDDGNGLGFFGTVFTAAACTFVAKGRAKAMARAMVATAGVQALFAALIATAPITQDPGRVVVLCGVFCLMWLGAAELFRRSAVAERVAA